MEGSGAASPTALNTGRTSRWGTKATVFKGWIKAPFALIYRKLGEGNEDEGPGQQLEHARERNVGMVGVSQQALKVELQDDGDESSDEEIEGLQHVSAAAVPSNIYVAQPHQWEKVDFATFSWCKHCGKYLFPLSPGFVCHRGCNYTVHKGKCMEAASKFDCYATDAQNRLRSESHLDTFRNQVAGHKGKAAFLKDQDGGKILKPLCPVEFQFYSVLARLASSEQQEGVSREDLEEMRTRLGDVSVWESFFPRFYGAAQMYEGDDAVVEHYIVMEDLTAGYTSPCICDLKIGARGYDDLASTKKVLQQKLLCSMTTSSTLGFRMCGMQYWQNEQKSYVVRDKLWGCKLKENTMQGALVQFLDNGYGVRFPLIVNWLPKLKRLEKWFEEQTLFTFYSSSILLIYEGSAPKDCTEQHVLKADIRLVDFAHTHPNTTTTPTPTRDENYLHGLRGVIRMLEDILRPVLTPEMVKELGYTPTTPAAVSEGDEPESAPSSGSFDIRHLFRRRAPRTARPGELSDETTASPNSSFSDLERFGQIDDTEDEEGAESASSGMGRRVASVPDDMADYNRIHRPAHDKLSREGSPFATPPSSPSMAEKRRSLSFGSSPAKNNRKLAKEA